MRSLGCDKQLPRPGGIHRRLTGSLPEDYDVLITDVDNDVLPYRGLVGRGYGGSTVEMP